MGVYPRTTAIFALALAAASVLGGFACGRRGAPLRPDAQSSNATLHLSHVVRMGDRAAFQSDNTAAIQVDLVRVADYTCGPAEPLPFFSAAAATDTLPPWRTLALPDDAAAYLRGRDDLGRESPWFYLPPATATPPPPAVEIRQFAGLVTLYVEPDQLSFRLEEKLDGDWIDYGVYQTSVARGPFPPGERLEFRLHLLRKQQNGWAYSGQPAIATPIVK